MNTEIKTHTNAQGETFFYKELDPQESLKISFDKTNELFECSNEDDFEDIYYLESLEQVEPTQLS